MMSQPADLRKLYVDFFVQRGHTHVRSAPIVPPDDPTLMFTSAGMVQFKPLYAGTVDLPYRRAVTVQKCLRAGGKGSDLENVGKTMRHHTFFEMLGNFSFGDYFKQEAMEWGWDFVWNVMKLPKDRLWGTTFYEDDEAAAMLEKIGLPRDRIIPLDEKENFWGPAGDTGACGPCSEIIFFTGTEAELAIAKKQDAKTIEKRIVEEGDLFLEIWNMVFPQFDQQPDGSRPPLKNRGIDTGAGLERMTTAVEFIASGGKIRSPYDTQILKPITDAAARALDVAWARGTTVDQRRLISYIEGDYRNAALAATLKAHASELQFHPVVIEEDKARFQVSCPALADRVNKLNGIAANGIPNWFGRDNSANLPIFAANAVADHVRALTFTIGEGLTPSNDGRGYVLRRILRRALRFASLTEIDKLAEESRDVDPFLYGLVDTVIEAMGDAYPELLPMQDHVKKVIRLEEESFLRRMKEGEKRLRGKIAQAKRDAQKTLTGNDIFELHATFGFPPEMTYEIVEDYNDLHRDRPELQVKIDRAGYDQSMQEHKALARKSWKGEQLGGHDALLKDILEEQGPTSFVGYDTLESTATVQAIFLDGERVDEAGEGNEVQVVLNETPFYAESGGQVGDKGQIAADDVVIQVEDTTKTPSGMILHMGRIESGVLRVGESVRAAVGESLRRSTMRNHTSTHLLQGALKRVLGAHITQSGSLVTPHGFRFDFTHMQALTADEILQVERLVNEQIRANKRVQTQVMSKDDAFKVGAIAPFGEKYGEVVRVVQVEGFSTEFCGGTHLTATGDIGLFLIVNESSIASGVRRIEAITGEAAFEAVAKDRATLSTLSRALATPAEELPDRIEALQTEMKSLRREMDRMRQKSSASEIDSVIAEAPMVNGVRVVTHVFDNLDIAALRSMADVVRQKAAPAVAALASVSDGGLTVICAVSDDIKNKLQAGAMVKEIGPIIGGGGGGRADIAQAGGKNPQKLPEAFKKVEEFVKSKMGEKA